MLSNQLLLPVDELYLNIVEEGKVSRLGVNNGVIVGEEYAPPKNLLPTKSVRILGTTINVPLILSASKTYEIPVEVGSVSLISSTSSSSVRDVVVKSRNGHRSLPDHNPLRYRNLEPADFYSFGLTYAAITVKLKFPAHKFHQNDVDFVVDQKYVDNAITQHAMCDILLAHEHAVDFCAVVMDPRLHMGPGGAFPYHGLTRMLGFGSIEMGCQLTRKLIELHGSDSLPCDVELMKRLFQKVTGRSDAMAGHPIQLLSLRVLHSILTSPLDDMSVSLSKDLGTRMARDAEIVKQRLHYLINEWMRRLYGDVWQADPYDPGLFEEPAEDSHDGKED